MGTADGNKEWLFSVEGMHCIRCIRKIQNISADFPAIKKIKVDMGNKSVQALTDEDFAVEEFIIKVKEEGFEIKNLPLDKDKKQTNKEGKSLLLRVGVAGACAGNIMLLSAAQYSGADLSEFEDLFSWLSLSFFIPILFYAAMPFYKNSYYSIKNRAVSIDTPIAIAIVAGGILSFYNMLTQGGGQYFDSISMFIFFLLASRYLIFKIQSKYVSPVSVEDVCAVESVERQSVNGFDAISIDKLKKDDVILLKRGDYLPVDGEVISKQATLSDAFFSGEFLPKEVEKFDRVLAGSQVVSDELQIKVGNLPDETRLSAIVDKLNLSLNAKTRISSLTDQGAHYLTLLVLGISAVIFFYFASFDMQEGVNRVLALLVVACPCGLAIATPLVQSLGVKFALENGLLIKNASVFEEVQKVRKVIFDKTGTLTKGEVRILSWSPTQPTDFQKKLIYNMERISEHPIAKALIKTVGEQEKLEGLSSLQEQIGLGVSGEFQGDFYKIQTLKKAEASKVALYKNDQEVLAAELDDEPSQEGLQVVKAFQDQGLKTYLLSGDKKLHVQRLAETMGIPLERAFFEVSPEEKEDFVKKINEQDSLYVGDGVNDSLAMSASLVSVSMDSSADVAYKSSDVHILNGGVGRLTYLRELSLRSLHAIKWILFISLVYNLVFAGLAVFGKITPLGAVIIMPLSSISVTFLGFYMLYQMKGKRQ